MADSNRMSADSLARLAKLQREPYSFTFLSAIRMVDALIQKNPPTGTSSRPNDESIRIGQVPTLNFAPTSIESFGPKEIEGRYRLMTYFLGLFGPNGPLPIHLTDFAQQRIRHYQDETTARFADVFHHRMASFFYRAWAASQPTVHMDRAESDRFTQYVASLCGIGMKPLQDRDEMPDRAKLYFAAFLGSVSKHSSGLASMLQSFFNATVKIEPFVSHWVQLPEDCHCRLGRNPESCTLGTSFTLGARVRDCQQRFRIVIGPMNLKQFKGLLPNGKSILRLRSFVDQYVGLELSWEVQLVLAKEEVPGLTLGRQGELGWTTWLSSRAPKNHASQLMVDPTHKSKRTVKSRDKTSQVEYTNC